jgi:TP901 family phage tail tape measure protein
MPDTQQTIAQIQQLVQVLNQLTSASSMAAADIKPLEDALNRLTRAGIGRFGNIAGSFKEFTTALRLAGKQAGLSRRELDQFLRTMRQVQATGRLGFGQARTGPAVAQRGIPSTLGLGGQQGADPTIGQQIEQQRAYFAQVLPGGARAIDTVEKSLGKAGLSMSELTDVTDDSARGIVRWTASIQGQDGITKRAVVTTNRWGQELKSTQRHLRTFGGAIARDIVEVTKWAIAVAIVYAPLRRLTQLMQEAVQIESKLADVQVALGKSTTTLNRVWEESAEVARELGVSAEGVLDGYVLAARATANITNPAERAAATTAVLKDSMLLAKLAGIDQSIAMDTLVGALRQLNLPLTEGTELLDKWVAVSKAANVSLHTLAESFAITSTAAANVGLDIDHLNGVIAAVAEVTTLSATESGNAVRALISGFQRDNSERELSKFGIAVRDVNGELRFFTEVIDDIIERKNLGLISSSELAKLAETIGGGARRGPQVTAVLENYSRVSELAVVSSKASGDAADALDIKMDTLQSSVQNLNNAFTELAKTLGAEGGFLDSARGTVEGLTGLVDLFSTMVGILGKATPAILAMAAALVVLRRSTRIGGLLEANVLGSIVAAPGTRFAGARLGIAQRLRGAGVGATQTFGGLAGRAFGGLGGAVGGAAVGAGLAALGGNFSKGNLDKAGATMGGAAVGAILTGGNPIGALIGGTIVDALFTNIVDKEHDLRGVFSRIFETEFAPDDADETPQQIDRRIQDAEEEITRLIGKTRGVESRLLGQTVLAIAEAALPGEAQGDALLALAEIAAGRETGAQAGAISTFFGLGDLTPEDKARIAELVDEIKAEAFKGFAEEAATEETSAFGLRLLGVSEELGPQAAKIISDQRSFLLQQVSRGEIGVRALTEFLNIGDFEQVASTVFTAMTALGDTTEDYADVAETLIKATEQERSIFVQLSKEIAVLENEYVELTNNLDDYINRLLIAENLEEQRLKGQQLSELFGATAAGQAFGEFEVPSIVDVSGGATEEQIRQAVATTRRLQEERVKALSPDPELREKAEQNWEDIIVQIGDTIESTYTGMFTDLDTGIFADVIKEMGLEAQEADLGILTPDLPSSQAGQLRGNIQFFQDIIKQLRPLEIEEIGIIFSDYVTDILHADNLAVQLAMQTLIDVNEQQLEGIFNIPEGVTAQIPFTGRLFFSDQPIPEAGAGNLLEALGPALDELPGTVEEVGGVAHTDALAQIELLNQMLATGIKSPELAEAIENAIRQLGGEPVEQFTGPDIVEWGEQIGEQISAVISEDVRAFQIENPELKTLPIEQIEEILNRIGEIPTITAPERVDEPVAEPLVVDTSSLEQALSEATTEFGLGGAPSSARATEGEIDFSGIDLGIDTAAFEAFFRDVQAWINQPVDLSNFFQGIGDFFEENFSVQTAEAAGLGGDILVQNPELRTLIGSTTLSNQEVLSALPQSIPVTVNTRIVNPVTVVVDGLIVQKALEERHYEDLASATRRTGAVGYIME